MRRKPLSFSKAALRAGAAVAVFWLLCTASCTAIPNPYGFKRGPYLQLVTPNSVLVVWDTAQPELGRVEYGPSASLGLVAEESQPTRHHAVNLNGLAPYSTYYYRISRGPIFSFRSAADSSQTRFRFGVIGDTQTYHKTHQAVITQILAAKPDTLIHLGDMNEHGESEGQWDDFFAIEAPLLATTPLFTTIGNHQRDSPNYYEAFHLPGNEHWYDFHYGHAHFICLEGDGYPEKAPYLSSEQLSWLEDTLKSNTAPWLFVYLHRAVYTSSDEEEIELALRQALVPLFERYGVNVVLMGHKHNYERLLANGITYIVSGGGGGRITGFGPVEPAKQVAVGAHHFVFFEVDGDRLRGTAIDLEGNVIDTFELGTTRR